MITFCLFVSMIYMLLYSLFILDTVPNAQGKVSEKYQ